LVEKPKRKKKAPKQEQKDDSKSSLNNEGKVEIIPNKI